MKYYAQYNHTTGELSKANVKCLNAEVDNIEISEEVFNSFDKYVYDNGNIVLDADYEHKQAVKNAEIRIKELKAELIASDYVANKLIEAYALNDMELFEVYRAKYKDKIEERKKIRAKIDELEEMING